MATTTADDLTRVFTRLRGIVKRHEKQLVVLTDDATRYYVNTTRTGANGKPICFGTVQIWKAHVTFSLMPVYGCPDVLDGVSDELRRHLKGKSCFHFKAVDEALFGELAELTKRGLERFRKAGYA